MTYVLETERLSLRQFTINDTKFIIELVNSQGWLKFIGDRNIKTKEQAEDYLRNGPLKSYKDNGFGLYLVELKTDKTPIGMCGLLKRDDLENPDIGFAFLSSFIGQGFAFESANAVVKFAKDILQLREILAITVPHNNSSIKLLEKLGLKLNKTIYNSPGKEKLALYQLKFK